MFCSFKYQNPRDKIEVLVLLNESNKWDTYVIFRLFGLLYLSAMHRKCIPAGAIISVALTLN